MKISVKYAVTGALSGAANGFFGAGGGLFLVPLLISWCGMEQKRAFATSVAVIFPLCAVSAVIYWLRVVYRLRRRCRICSAARQAACWPESYSAG